MYVRRLAPFNDVTFNSPPEVPQEHLPPHFQGLMNSILQGVADGDDKSSLEPSTRSIAMIMAQQQENVSASGNVLRCNHIFRGPTMPTLLLRPGSTMKGRRWEWSICGSEEHGVHRAIGRC